MRPAFPRATRVLSSLNPPGGTIHLGRSSRPHGHPGQAGVIGSQRGSHGPMRRDAPSGSAMSSLMHRLVPLVYLTSCAGMFAATSAAALWVDTVVTSAQWAAYACREHLLTRVCDLDKDYRDPGALPPVISVGDVIHYQNSRGHTVAFTVRAISFFVFDRDTKEPSSSKWPGGKKGETLCSLFDTASKETIGRGYASKILIKECQERRK